MDAQDVQRGRPGTRQIDAGLTSNKKGSSSKPWSRHSVPAGFRARSVNVQAEELEDVDVELGDLMLFDSCPDDDPGTLVAQSRTAEGTCCERGCQNPCAYIVQPVAWCNEHYSHECSRQQRPPSPKAMVSVATQATHTDSQDIVFPPRWTHSATSTKTLTTPPMSRAEILDIEFPPHVPPRSLSEPLAFPRDNEKTDKPVQSSLSLAKKPQNCRSRGCKYFGSRESGGYCSEHLKLYTIADASGMLNQSQSHSLPPCSREAEDLGSNQACSRTPPGVTPQPSSLQPGRAIPADFKQTYESTVRQMSSGKRCVNLPCHNFGNQHNQGLCNHCFQNHQNL